MAYLAKRSRFKKTSFVLRKEYSHQCYNVSSKGHTIFRVFPAPAEGGGFEPQIVPVDGDPLEGLSNSFAEVEMVDFLGKDKLSFITTCSDINGEENVSPCLMFYNVLQDFVKTESKKAVKGQPFSKALTVWESWFTELKGIASLPYIRMLFQGVLIEHAGEPCTNKDGKQQNRVPIVLCLNRSGTIDIEDKLVTKLDAAEDLSAANSKIGDITGLTTGGYIKVSSYKNKEKQTRYQVERSEKAIPLKEEMVHAHFVPWEELLNVQPASWQIEKLVEQFGAEAVDYAFRDDAVYGPMIPKEVAGSYERVFGSGETPAPTATPALTTTPVQESAPAEQPAQEEEPVLTAEIVSDDDEVPMNFNKEGKAVNTTPSGEATSSAVEIAMQAAHKNQSN